MNLKTGWVEDMQRVHCARVGNARSETRRLGCELVSCDIDACTVLTGGPSGDLDYDGVLVLGVNESGGAAGLGD